MKNSPRPSRSPLSSLLLYGVAVFWTLSSCHPPRKSSVHTDSETMVPRNMTPFDDQNWIEGPEIADSATLLSALQSPNTGSRRRLWRLPVVVTLEEGGLRMIQRVTIGTEAAASSTSGIRLRLEDSALGVSLAERLRQNCLTGTTCLLWVAGYWGSDMPGGFGAPPPGVHAFSLRAVLGKQAGDWATSGDATKARFRDE